jgi:hypothetical protein
MLDVSFTLLVDAYVQTGMNTIEAIERVEEFAYANEPQTEAQVAKQRVPSAADNDRSLAELEKMMMGVSFR